MKFRKLGNTNIDLSLICLGTMTFGEQNTESEAHDQLNYAIEERGINFIDTAELYPVPSRKETSGKTEKYIGTWLKKRGKRDQLFIASKIAGPGDYTNHIRKASDYDKSGINEALDASLIKLQTDYIDLYQIHWPARKTNFFGKRGYNKMDGWKDNFLEILEAVDGLIKAGKVRYFGISNETAWGLMNYLNLAERHNLPSCVSVQNPYNLLNRLYEVGMSEISLREEVGLLAYSPMAFGMLSGKYHLKHDTPNDRINKFSTMARYNSQNSKLATAKYLELATKYGISLAQMSLAFINQQDFVTSNIIGATNLDQLKENIDSVYIELSGECMKEIHLIHEMIPNPAP